MRQWSQQSPISSLQAIAPVHHYQTRATHSAEPFLKMDVRVKRITSTTPTDSSKDYEHKPFLQRATQLNQREQVLVLVG